MRTYLKQLREQAGLTHKQVSEKLEISEPYYQMIEAGKRQKRMDISLAAKLAAIFGVSLDFILAEENKLQLWKE